jgi:predicted SAM-dependent methyltransferase
MMKILNLGCGRRFHSSHVNVDFVPYSDEVQQGDLTRGLNFPDACFDVVYHSHVLEHLDLSSGLRFLRECARVLKPGGIIRVVVPDLERLAAEYLASAKACIENPTARNRADHEWMLIELYDQVSREKTGGRMADYVRTASHEDLVTPLRRCGAEIAGLLPKSKQDPGRLERRVGTSMLAGRAYERLAVALFGWLAWGVLGARGRASWLAGWFRSSGEVHRQMYDFALLRSALEGAGFIRCVRRTHLTSFVASWSTYGLDNESDGSAYKPESLYVEALKASEVASAE